MRALLLAAAAVAGCEKTPEMPPPAAELRIAAGSSWRVERGGDAPMLRGPGGFVFVQTAHARERMPGLSPGTDAGPELSLLAGDFAPLVVPDRTDHAHRVRIEAEGATLAVDFEGAFSARVLPARGPWSRILLEGRANLVLPSGETRVKGFRGGRPSFAERVVAWSEASVAVRAVDRLEVDTERRGTIVVETSCPPRMIRPRARANTSSFLVRLGPPRSDFDPRYAPERAEDPAPACSGTATVSVRRP